MSDDSPDDGPVRQIHRIVANIRVDETVSSRAFYSDFLGLEAGFDLGWVVGLRSGGLPDLQVHLVTHDPTAPVESQLSVDVADVDEAYATARRRGYTIVHPLTTEPWGVRRFFVRAPDGVVLNIAQHDD